MSLVAFRRDTEDPEIVRQFAALVGVEDRLKMLCLMTLADVEAVSRETLTPWKEELLWRLYVDTYNHLTLSYGDEVIDAKQAAIAELIEQRPDDCLGRRICSPSSRGCRAATCSCSPPDAVYRHVRLARDLGPGFRPGLARAQGRRLGADRAHPRPAVSLLEHLGRPVVVRHGHPARLRLHQAERPRRRHVPLHRRGAVPRAERGRRRAARARL